jgi:hypothetical protein
MPSTDAAAVVDETGVKSRALAEPAGSGYHHGSDLVNVTASGGRNTDGVYSERLLDAIGIVDSLNPHIARGV